MVRFGARMDMGMRTGQRFGLRVVGAYKKNFVRMALNQSQHFGVTQADAQIGAAQVQAMKRTHQSIRNKGLHGALNGLGKLQAAQCCVNQRLRNPGRNNRRV